MYCLVSEDLRGLGGPMGTEYTTINYKKYFRKKINAKEFAQKEYNRERIRWKKRDGEVTSGDLLFVMYTITKIKFED